MTHFRTASSVGQVLLTAVMTLVAGIPQLECRCPGETVKPQAKVASRNPCCGSGCCVSDQPGGCCCASARASRTQNQARVHADHVKTRHQPAISAAESPQCVTGLAQTIPDS